MSHTAADDKKNGIFPIALNLTMAALLSGLIIAGVYFITAPVAAQQRIILRDQSMKALVPDANNFQPLEGHEGWFAAQKDSEVFAFVFPGEGKGYGGSIKMLVAAQKDGTLIGYKILSHNETPGLGDKTALPKFSGQFPGKKVEETFLTKDSQTGKIDAITGVTISSRAVTKAVREALTTLNESASQQGTAP